MANRPTLSSHRISELDLLLQVEGALSNSRIRSVFGLERAQASRLLTSYLEWRQASAKEKLSRRGALWLEANRLPVVAVDGWSLSRYLHLARDAGTSNEWFEDARIDFAATPGQLLQDLRQACLTARGLRITYTSLSTAGVTQRLVYPHAVVRIGRRVHARAWCCLRQDYRDFALPRITAVEAVSDQLEPGRAKPDALWLEQVMLRFRAHRALGEQQKFAVRREFLDEGEVREMTVRAALVPYMILEAQAATRPETELPPRYQLEVDNLEQIRPFLFSAESQG